MIKRGANFFQQQSKKRLVMDNQLKQIDFLDRRVYERREGVYYPSVTTVLSYMPKNKFFEEWLKDVGKNADFIVKQAGREGTAVHEAVEKLLKGEKLEWINEHGSASYSETVWTMILKFADFWSTVQPELISCEEFIFSDIHKYAGTADVVCKIDREVWLIDVKTSNTLSRSYELQLAAYATAWQEIKKQKIDRTGILWLKSPTRGPANKKIQGKGWRLKPVDNIEYNFDLFKTIYKLYKLDNPKIAPIYKKYPTEIQL